MLEPQHLYSSLKLEAELMELDLLSLKFTLFLPLKVHLIFSRQSLEEMAHAPRDLSSLLEWVVVVGIQVRHLPLAVF